MTLEQVNCNQEESRVRKNNLKKNPAAFGEISSYGFQESLGLDIYRHIFEILQISNEIDQIHKN